MLYRGLLGTEYSGRLDGLVASVNRGTTYFRATGPAPVPPGGYSTNQLAMQAAVSTATAQWKAMDPANRRGWELWAIARRPDRVARRYARTGFNEFIRAAAIRHYANTSFSLSLAVPDTPPTLSSQDPGPFPTVTLGLFPPFFIPAVQVTFDNSQPWASNDDGCMLVQLSRPQAPTRNRAYGGYFLSGIIVGDSTTPPTSPKQFGAGGTTTGQHIFTRIRVSTPEGGLSEPMYSEATL